MKASGNLQQFLRVLHEPTPARKPTTPTAPVTPLRWVAQPVGVVTTAASVMSRDDAGALMWNHYKDRRTQYITDIRLCREHILAALMCGISPETAFEPYLRPTDAVAVGPTPRRRAA